MSYNPKLVNLQKNISLNKLKNGDLNSGFILSPKKA